jgi:hypothetical protein
LMPSGRIKQRDMATPPAAAFLRLHLALVARMRPAGIE